MLRPRLSLTAFSACLLCCAHAAAADGYMAVVTASPGNVMEGSKLLGTVPKGTQLWVFQEQRRWLEVKLPGQEKRGWMQPTELERVRRTDAQEARLQAANEHRRLSHAHKAAYHLREALSEMRFALSIQREILGDEHPATIASLSHEGYLLYLEGDFPAARERFEDALAVYRRVLGNEHPLTADALNNLGAVVHAQDDLEVARQCCEEALAVYRRILGKEHPRTAGVLKNLGTLLRKQEEFAAGRKYLDEALAIHRNAFGDEHLGTADILERLAALSRAEGDFTTAAQTWDQALRNLRRHSLRTTAGLAPEERPQYLENLYVRDFQAALSLGLAAAGEPEVAELSAGWILNSKGVAADAMAAASGRVLTTDPWIDLNHVRQAVPKTSVLIHLIRLRPSDLKAKERLAPVYVAWLIPAADQGVIRIVDLGDAEAVDAAVAAFRQAIAKAPTDLEQDAEAVRKTAASLADLVWKPLAESVADKEELILSPDGALWLTPWAAVPIGEDKLLIEQFRLRYVTSGRELVASDDTKSVTSDPARIVADPDFDQSERDALSAYLATLYPGLSLTAIPASPEARPQFEPHAPRSASPIGKAAHMPATGVEATIVAPQLKQFTGAEPRMYVARNAQEGIVKLIRNPRVLLIATHGYFLPDQRVKVDKRSERFLAGEKTKNVAFDENGDAIENPLLRCGLLLAGCNERDKYTDPGLGDGVLTGMEVVNLDLRGTEMVVLSACETGIGTVNNGEGVAGLRQAFQLAGAKSVVSTLWQIPDRQSAVLMNDFFTNLAAGKSRADALRDAQLTMIKSRREKFGAAHPLFWAAWTITGN